MDPSHRFSRRVALVTASLVVLVALVPSATAGTRTDTVHIDPGEHAAISIDFTDGPATRITYDIQVDQGPNIDVLIMDNANHQRYTQGDSFSYEEAWSDLDTGNTDHAFTLEAHGTWWVVLDHTAEPDGGTQPATLGAEAVTVSYTISDKVDAERSAKDLMDRIPAPGALALIAALPAAALVAGRR